MQEQIDILTGQVCKMVLKRILESGYKEKLWVQKKLASDQIESGLVFCPAKNNQQELLEELYQLFQSDTIEKKHLPFSVETKNRIMLEFEMEKHRIPFFIEIKPYRQTVLYPIEETLEKMTYYRFPTEEYVAQGFYEILDKLELLNDLFWYKEIYDIILIEAIDGRRVCECFRKHLERKKIPSLEKRLDTIKSYENYGYMKKKWKKEQKRQKKEFPEWNQVVSLLITFFSPLFQAVIRDEIFFEDWMPQLGRYL